MDHLSDASALSAGVSVLGIRNSLRQGLCASNYSRWRCLISCRPGPCLLSRIPAVGERFCSRDYPVSCGAASPARTCGRAHNAQRRRNRAWALHGSVALLYSQFRVIYDIGTTFQLGIRHGIWEPTGGSGRRRCRDAAKIDRTRRATVTDCRRVADACQFALHERQSNQLQ